MSFWNDFRINVLEDLSGIVYNPIPEGEFIAIPARPSTAQLAEDLLVDPEALKLETHDPGVFDEKGDYIPMYSDDPKDLEHLSPTPLDAPDGDTVPESPSADKISNSELVEDN